MKIKVWQKKNAFQTFLLKMLNSLTEFIPINSGKMSLFCSRLYVAAALVQSALASVSNHQKIWPQPAQTTGSMSDELYLFLVYPSFSYFPFSVLCKEKD